MFALCGVDMVQRTGPGDTELLARFRTFLFLLLGYKHKNRWGPKSWPQHPEKVYFKGVESFVIK